ncbi:MAG: hypothetical protein CXT69_00900 [Methanobacteriota archaeon]|jgi:SepF-like predicted cell division protein (DUF552 family)|nr:MAG: hypothetical protein CXT69_00900 [Euryarchaeota archaeon]HIK78931.1 hypothetical protein [Candidatus Poseidoniales archaeon]
MARRKKDVNDPKQSSLDAFANIVRQRSGIDKGKANRGEQDAMPASENISQANSPSSINTKPTQTLDAYTNDGERGSAPNQSTPGQPDLPLPSETPAADASKTAGETPANDRNHAPQPRASATPSQVQPPASGVRPPRTFQMPSSGPIALQTPTTDIMYHDLGKMYPEAPIPENKKGMVLHRALLQDLTGVSDLLNWVADGEGVIVELKRIMAREVEFQTVLMRLSTFIEDDIGGQIIQLTDSRLLLLPPGCKGVSGIEMEAFAANL